MPPPNKCCNTWCCRIYCPAPCLDRCAFYPPFPETYSFVRKDAISTDFKFQLLPHARAPLGMGNFLKMETFYVKTRRGNSIACLYVNFMQDPKFVVLFSHGNAEDLGDTCHICFALATLLNCNVITYDYSGYGISSGRPSEKNVYSDAEAAFAVLLQKYNFRPEQILIIGQSIGSAPTVHLGTLHKNLSGVILISPIMSECRVICPKRKCNFCDYFLNIEKARKVNSRTLLIHGRSDTLVVIKHSLELSKRFPNLTPPSWIGGADHNNIYEFPEVWLRIMNFTEEVFPFVKYSSVTRDRIRNELRPSVTAAATTNPNTNAGSAQRNAEMRNEGVASEKYLDGAKVSSVGTSSYQNAETVV